MEKTFASAKLSRDPQARALIEYLVERERDLGIVDGVLYYEFPLFRDANDELHRANVLLASRSHGILIFGVVLGTRLERDDIRVCDEKLSQLESVLFGKFLQSRRLRRTQRELAFPLKSVLFGTGAAQVSTENSLVTSLNMIPAELEDLRMSTPLEETAWRELRAVLEGTKAIIRPKPREVPERLQHLPESKVSVLAELEGEIANFDANQRRAAISIVDGPQRIRGLAGSGKTIVLAMKAAHIHLTDPSLEILFTFYTKSLYDFIRRLITRFYRQFNDHDPDWTRVHVRHAWGGRYLEGVYYNACLDNDVEPRKLGSVMGREDPFEVVCSELLRKAPLKQAYDYVLMDEAQDFPPSFYRLCFHLTRGNTFDRNVIWAYDELQNIMNVRVPGAAELFGSDSSGTPLMDLDRASRASQQGANHDIVLYKSYRNPREILVCAHALGFGIYSDTMVQTLENKAHWEDLGYQVGSGNFHIGSPIVVVRPEANSPLTISRRQQTAEMIKTYVAANVAQEVSWVCEGIRGLIDEGLNPSDLMVVCLDDQNARTYFKEVSNELASHGVQTNNLLADPYSAPRFNIPDHVTLSTVYRAKGNESAVVFAVGMDALFPSRREQKARNKLFTAFTRAKGWLRASGIGQGAQYFVNEIERAIAEMPRLVFTQPDPTQILTLQRDLSDRSSKLRKLQEQVDRQLDELDFDPQEREAFISSLQKKK